MIISFDESIGRLKNEEIVGFKTETFYGLGANPRSASAVAGLLELKGRVGGEGIPLILDTSERLAEIIKIESTELRKKRRRLQELFWPGPLTLVIDVKPEMFEIYQSGIFGFERSLAVRVSAHEEARHLAAQLGGAITATSANPHGLPPAAGAEEFERYFPKLGLFDCKSKEVPASPGRIFPSTILDARSLPFKIIRRGAVAEEELLPYLL